VPFLPVEAYTRRIGWQVFFGAVLIMFGCGLMVLVDAPRRVLHRVRPPRFAVLAPVQTPRHVIPASFARQADGRGVAAAVPMPEWTVASPRPDEAEDLWVMGPGSPG